MSFNDIFKSSFLENVSEFSVLDTVLGLGHGQADVGPFHKKKPPSGLRVFYNSIVPDSAVGCKHLQRFCVLMWDVLYLFYKKHGGHHPGRRNR